MTKVIKSKGTKSKLKTTAKGRVEKLSKKLNGKSKLANRKIKLANRKSANNIEDNDNSIEIKKKPSKAELKSVIEALKKDPGLLLIRKALKYIPYYLKSEGLTKKLLKEVIRLWAEAGEKVRVVCLLCLIRIYTKLQDKERKQLVIKKLYTSFLDKCRITKQETMSMIGFMRHSLIELYKLDSNIAFKQAQASCQQLTLTLKNACTHKNEETYKTVLNWQFANCLILLSNLIIANEDDSSIKSLAHQVIQLNLGALNFLKSPRYYPFYCHLIENLIGLSVASNLFIPVLPLILDILGRIQIPKEKKTASKEDADEEVNENEKNEKKKNGKKKNGEEKISEERPKEYNMDLLNHVSLDESHCLEYNIAVLEKLYELMLLYLASQCHKIAFPELVLLPIVQLKKWIKKNPLSQSQKFKVLLDKIKSDCEKIEEARKGVDFAFIDYTAVDAWEKKIKDSNKLGLPRLVAK